MGRHLLKAPNGVIVEWSSVVDAPVSAWRSIETLSRCLKQEAREDALRDYERNHGARIRRLEERGTSAFVGEPAESGWQSCVGFNRAGPGEKRLGDKALLTRVTAMADQCEADLAAYFAQDPIEVARREGAAAERARVVGLLREEAGRHERAADEHAEHGANISMDKAIGARGALVEMAERIEREADHG